MTKTTFSHSHLRSLINRVLRLKEEQDTLTEDIKEVYSEAKALGFDKTVMGLAVTRLRKEAKDPAGIAETDSMLDLYLSAYRGDDEDGEGNHTGQTGEAVPERTAGRETASQANSLTRVGAKAKVTPAGSPSVAGADTGAGETPTIDPAPGVPHDPVTGEVVELRRGAAA